LSSSQAPSLWPWLATRQEQFPGIPEVLREPQDAGVIAEVSIPFRLRSLDHGWLDVDVALAVLSQREGRRLRKRKGRNTCP